MIKANLPPAIFLCLMLVLAPLSGGAAQSIVLTDEVQMTLGKAFLSEGDYYRAVTEFKKLTFLFPASDLLPEAIYRIGMAYYLGEDYPAAIRSFSRVRQLYATDYFSSAAFYEGLSYSKLGQHAAAALAFERSRQFDASHVDAANAHLGLALNALQEEDVALCRTELEDFLVRYPGDGRNPAIESSFSLLDTYAAQPQKSAALAAALSAVLPGSGQVYAEHHRDGLMAFVVNGLFIAGTVAAIDNENYPLAAIVGGAGLPFYLGNIYGAADSARTWNLSLARTLREQLSLSLNFRF